VHVAEPQGEPVSWLLRVRRAREVLAIVFAAASLCAWVYCAS